MTKRIKRYEEDFRKLGEIFVIRIPKIVIPLTPPLNFPNPFTAPGVVIVPPPPSPATFLDLTAASPHMLLLRLGVISLRR